MIDSHARAVRPLALGVALALAVTGTVTAAAPAVAAPPAGCTQSGDTVMCTYGQADGQVAFAAPRAAGQRFAFVASGATGGEGGDYLVLGTETIASGGSGNTGAQVLATLEIPAGTAVRLRAGATGAAGITCEAPPAAGSAQGGPVGGGDGGAAACASNGTGVAGGGGGGSVVSLASGGANAVLLAAGGGAGGGGAGGLSTGTGAGMRTGGGGSGGFSGSEPVELAPDMAAPGTNGEDGSASSAPGSVGGAGGSAAGGTAANADGADAASGGAGGGGGGGFTNGVGGGAGINAGGGGGGGSSFVRGSFLADGTTATLSITEAPQGQITIQYTAAADAGPPPPPPGEQPQEPDEEPRNQNPGNNNKTKPKTTATVTCTGGTCVAEPKPGKDAKFRVAAVGTGKAKLIARLRGGVSPNCPDYRETTGDWVTFRFQDPRSGLRYRKLVSVVSLDETSKRKAKAIKRRTQICFQAPYAFVPRPNYRRAFDGRVHTAVLPECSPLLLQFARSRGLAFPCVYRREIVRKDDGWVVKLKFRVPPNRLDPKART